jgi:uncharacterized membrane protein YozB (DUF420 family)
MNYPGMDGFLRHLFATRASLMLDVVFLAMFAVIPVLGFSILLARRGRYGLHKRIQLTLGFVLLAAVTLFELEMRIVGWRQRAADSPYLDVESGTGHVMNVLYVHLFFAITTAVLWFVVLFRGWRNFPVPPVPGPHSAWHKRWARLAALDMVFTAVTGWMFYWLAFVAS